MESYSLITNNIRPGGQKHGNHSHQDSCKTKIAARAHSTHGRGIGRPLPPVGDCGKCDRQPYCLYDFPKLSCATRLILRSVRFEQIRLRGRASTVPDRSGRGSVQLFVRDAFRPLSWYSAWSRYSTWGNSRFGNRSEYSFGYWSRR